MSYLGQHWGEIDLYVEHGIDEAELVTHLPLPEPENVDDIQEDVEEDPGVGTQVDNGPGVVSQAENDQVQYSGGEFSDEEADLESNQEDGDSDLERSPLHEAGFVDVECGNAENRDEEIRSARAEGDTENEDLGGVISTHNGNTMVVHTVDLVSPSRETKMVNHSNMMTSSPMVKRKCL
nr:uncharacterized protein LOC109164765 [Ipomoea trifida]